MFWRGIRFWLLFATLTAHADQLTVYAISAPQPTVWDSPRSLLASTVLNSIRSTYAPNGHIMIQLEQGNHAWFTSMASARKFQTFATTVREGLGLSSLYHDFEGDLDSAEDSIALLNKASEDRRLATMQIDVPPAVMKEMLSFLDQWIRRGSFRHYRGGQIASAGLGAGCADFVMWFMNRALLARAPLADWMQEKYLPKDLLEDTHPAEIYRRTEWAHGESDGRFFMIPDPELIYRWIVERSPETRELRVHGDQLAKEKVHFSAKLIRETAFDPPYAAESDKAVAETWAKISIR